MQKWWLLGAGVVGVGLAVLLLGGPFDTGADVGPLLEGTNLSADPRPTAGDGVLVRGPDGAPIVVPVADVSAVADGGLAGAAATPPSNGQANPLAERVAARRDVPESRLAARTLAPWTQVRREIAGAAPDDPNAQELVGAINDLIEELRVLRREPQIVDFEDLRAQQTALSQKILASSWANDEIKTMLDIVDQRHADYNTEKGAE